MKNALLVGTCLLLLAGLAAPAFGGGGREAPEPGVLEDPVRDEWTGTGVVTLYATIADYTAATGESITEFSEAPSLAQRVQAGEIPALEQRLPAEPLVVQPAHRIGVYGGRFRESHLGTLDELEDLFRELPILFDAELNGLAPNIIKSWEIQDNARTMVFHVREGIKWSDGQPFTADDFVFWSEAIAWNEELNPAGVRDMRIGGEMGYFEKIDDYTFRAVFPDSNATFIDRMASGMIPYAPKHYLTQFHPDYTPRDQLNAIVSQRGYSTWLDLFESESEYEENPDTPVVTAWKLHTGSPDDPVQRFERNPYYWKVDIAGNQLPYVDGIDRFNVGESVEALVLRAVAGETDYGDAESFGQVANYSLLRQNEQSGNYRIVQMVERNPRALGAIFFNMNHPDPQIREIIRNRDFRLALSLAIDNQRINNIFYEGTYALTQGYTPPPGPPYHGEREIFQEGMTYEPDRANQLLDEMGLRWNSARTRRVTDDGRELSFTFLVRPRTPDFVPKAEMIEENWEEVGVGITIRPVSGGLWNETVESNTHDIAMDQWAFGGNLPEIPVFRDLAPRDDGWKADPGWGLWVATGGDLGIEPPDSVKRLGELQRLALGATTAEERTNYERQMYELHAEQMWWLVPVLQPGNHAQTHWFYFHNRLQNVTVPAPRENYYGIPASWYIAQ